MKLRLYSISSEKLSFRHVLSRNPLKITPIYYPGFVYNGFRAKPGMTIRLFSVLPDFHAEPFKKIKLRWVTQLAFNPQIVKCHLTIVIQSTHQHIVIYWIILRAENIMSLLNIQDPQKNVAFSLFVLGFRPFFLAAGIFSVISMALWMVNYSGQLVIPLQGLANFHWHAHEMIYGFSLAIISGFLLTAIKNWTGDRKSVV